MSDEEFRLKLCKDVQAKVLALKEKSLSADPLIANPAQLEILELIEEYEEAKKAIHEKTRLYFQP